MTSSEAFFALVRRHVTGPMNHADYAEIGEYDEVTDGARGVPLVAPHWPWLGSSRWFASRRSPFSSARNQKRPKERALRVGYEGSTEDGDDDEKWISYFPDTRELDVRDWSEELRPLADWDVWTDQAVPTTEDLERRLRVLGTAIGRAGGRPRTGTR